jgi:hypothetical protein
MTAHGDGFVLGDSGAADHVWARTRGRRVSSRFSTHGPLADTEVSLGLSGYKGIDEIWEKSEAVLEKAETSCECTITTELWCTSLLHNFRANVR